VDGVDSTLLVLSMGLGIGGVSLLSTVIAAPVVIDYRLQPYRVESLAVVEN